MSLRSRVTWSEGLFLQPQHFQQHLRYLEHFIGSVCGSLRPYPWGLSELTLDSDLLKIGKIAVRSASGVFPDGTPFNIPHDDAPPKALESDERTRDTTVYLALPVRRDGVREIAGSGDRDTLTRYASTELDIVDVHTHGQRTTSVQVASLRTQLLLDKDARDAYACIGIAHVIERSADKSILLAKNYIPTVLDCTASPRLSGFITELQGLYHSRAEELAGRVSGTGRGTAEVADFVLLQILNRYESLLLHLATVRGLHPEDLFRLLVEMAGTLATHLTDSRRPAKQPTYTHHDLEASFEPMVKTVRVLLQRRQAERTHSFALEDAGYGVFNADVADKNMLSAGRFVFAVRADIAAAQLLSRVPDLIKVAALDHIHSAVADGVRMIGFRALQVAPNEIPFHSGFAYFELDRGGPHWSAIETSGWLSIYVPDRSFPNLGLELWWIAD